MGQDMEERVKRVESTVDAMSARLATIERDVAVVSSNYATGKDVAEAKNAIISWVVGAVVVWGSTVVGAAFFVSRQVH